MRKRPRRPQRPPPSSSWPATLEGCGVGGDGGGGCWPPVAVAPLTGRGGGGRPRPPLDDGGGGCGAPPRPPPQFAAGGGLPRPGDSSDTRRPRVVGHCDTDRDGDGSLARPLTDASC